MPPWHERNGGTRVVMKLLDQLVGARPATLSMEIKRCFEAARREAAVRGASLLSQSYCALVLLRRQPTACVSMPNRPAPVPRDQLIAEIVKRLPPVTRDVPRESPPIQFHSDLAVLTMKHGSIGDPATLLNLFLCNPDDLLTDALARL
jgi:hypothetical protein